MPKQTLPFAGYVRVSRLGGRTGDGFYSPAIQQETIERLARANELSISEVVEELGVSGGRAAAERELERLVRAVEAGTSGGIIAWKLARFSRNLADGALTAARIVDAGGRLITSDFDSAASGSRLILAILLALAEDERDRARESFMESTRRAGERGIPSGRPPFGFQAVKDENGSTLRLDVDEPAATAVVRAFELRAKGGSLNEIVDQIEADSGRRFSRPAVSKMLSSVAYLGRLERVGEHEAVVNENAYPPIVTRKLFDRAQRAGRERKARFTHPRDGSHKNTAAFQGIVTCGTCAKPLGVVASGKDTKRVAHYTCRNRYCKAGVAISAAKLDEWLVPLLREREPELDYEGMLIEWHDAQQGLSEAVAQQRAWLEGADIQALGAEAYNREAARQLARVEEAQRRWQDAADEMDASTEADSEAERWRSVARRHLERLAVKKSPTRGNAAPPVEKRVEVVWR